MGMLNEIEEATDARTADQKRELAPFPAAWLTANRSQMPKLGIHSAEVVAFIVTYDIRNFAGSGSLGVTALRPPEFLKLLNTAKP